MGTLLGIGFLIANWRIVCAIAAAIIALIVILKILEKRRRTKRAAELAAIPAGRRIIGNKNTMTFHRVNCRALSGVSSDQRVAFLSASEAEAHGYKACKVCNPWR